MNKMLYFDEKSLISQKLQLLLIYHKQKTIAYEKL